ncbi:hypothetical protein D9M69_610580 [compost metagenome]
MPGGDPLAQGELAAHIGIVGVAIEQAVDGGLDYGLRGVEIRVADRQQQDVFASRLALQGTVVDVPGRRAVAGDALGQVGKAHG